MLKNATVIARVEPQVKIEAEDILQRLGLPVSLVINTLYRQIIAYKGLPFALTLPGEPETLDALSQAALDIKLQHSYEQSLAGEGRSYHEVFDELERALA